MKAKVILTGLAICCVSFIYSCTNTNKSAKNMETTKNEATNNNVEYIKPDVYKTSEGDLKVTVVGHGSLMFEYNNKIIHVDPYSKVADYTKLPKADLILITHEHYDHLDSTAIAAIKKEDTKFIESKVCNEMLGYGDVIENGGETSFAGIDIKAVPAYNMVNKRPDGEFYHPKGRGNGYVLTFGDLVVYVAADTENIPEMDNLKGKVDIAFLPKNLPYTMTDEMFADAAQKVAPNYLYPYHMNDFDLNKITSLINDNKIQLIVKPMSNL